MTTTTVTLIMIIITEATMDTRITAAHITIQVITAARITIQVITGVVIMAADITETLIVEIVTEVVITDVD